MNAYVEGETPLSARSQPTHTGTGRQGVPTVCNLLLAHLVWRYLHSTYFARGEAFAGYGVRPADAERLGRAMARAANAVAGVHAHLFAGSDVRVTVKVGRLCHLSLSRPDPSKRPASYSTSLLTKRPHTHTHTRTHTSTSGSEREVALRLVR